MSHPAIDAHHLSKSFRIGALQQRYVTLRDTLVGVATAPLASLRAAFRRKPHIWALDDVSFQVGSGDIVGVIGRNGAGKSTLLKVLARITSPTKGYADVTGRVGSLLEIGTGFHPELTGRENIYLSGAILGMRKAEIDRRFDEIVAFAEVEKFVDTPVKRFSTGMFLRLAFAVAAHLETEILLVDEVLAVGDAGFQKKCLGRLGDAAGQGRTVLFVSHNMGAVRSLCAKGIVLERGRVQVAGAIGECIEAYYRAIGALPGGEDRPESAPFGFGPIHIEGTDGHTISPSDDFELCTELRLDSQAQGFMIVCQLHDTQGRLICHLREDSRGLGFTGDKAGAHTVSLRFPALWLCPGLYSVEFHLVLCGEYRSDEIASSDKFPLDVVGKECFAGTLTHVEPLLQPPVDWHVEKNGGPVLKAGPGGCDQDRPVATDPR